MSAAVKRVASTETAKDNKTLAAQPRVKSVKTTATSHTRKEEAQRSKWGVETVAVRPIHARKF